MRRNIMKKLIVTFLLWINAVEITLATIDDAMVQVMVLSSDNDGQTCVLKTPVTGEVPEWCRKISPLASLWQYAHDNNVAIWFPGWYLLEEVFNNTVYDLHTVSPLTLPVLSVGNVTSLKYNRGIKQLTFQAYDDPILTALAGDTFSIDRHKHTATMNYIGRECYVVIGKINYGKPLEKHVAVYSQHEYSIQQLKQMGIWVQDWSLAKLKEHCKLHQHVIVHGGGIIES